MAVATLLVSEGLVIFLRNITGLTTAEPSLQEGILAETPAYFTRAECSLLLRSKSGLRMLGRGGGGCWVPGSLVSSRRRKPSGKGRSSSHVPLSPFTIGR